MPSRDGRRDAALSPWRAPGFHTDIPLAALACFYEHSHEFYARQPWLRLEKRFRIARLSMDTLGWRHAYAELLPRGEEDWQVALHRSIDSWRAGGEQLVLRRLPRTQLHPRQVALMEEFDWLAPIALQPTAQAYDRRGRLRDITTLDLQRLSAAAITFERLAEEIRLQPPPENATWLEATLEIEDELWSSRVRAQTPPPALLGVRLDAPARPLRSWQSDGDDEFARFLVYVDRRDRARHRLEQFSQAASQRLGPELLLLCMGPYLVDECVRLPAGSTRRVARALWSFQAVIRRMIDDGALEVSCLEEFQSGLARQGKLLGEGVELAQELESAVASERCHGAAGNVRALLRIESRDGKIVQLESREGERVTLQLPSATSKLRDGWWLDLTLRREEPLDRVAAVHALLPPAMARHVGRDH